MARPKGPKANRARRSHETIGKMPISPGRNGDFPVFHGFLKLIYEYLNDTMITAFFLHKTQVVFCSMWFDFVFMDVQLLSRLVFFFIMDRDG